MGIIPDYLDDIAPPLATAIEHGRQRALAWLAAHSYQLITPPMAEYLETLTAGDRKLDLQTFKMTDTLSGRTLGIRADQTPQIARFDATTATATATTPRRYCYCGPVLFARPPQPWQSREGMQLGAELFGVSAPTGDWEIIRMALGVLQTIGISDLAVDLGHARLLTALISELDTESQAEITEMASRRDITGLRTLPQFNQLPRPITEAITLLTEICGSVTELEKAEETLTAVGVQSALDELNEIIKPLTEEGYDAGVRLSDFGTHGYHTGAVFTITTKDRIVAQGGRYQTANGDEAVGFSSDLRQMEDAITTTPPPVALKIPIIRGDQQWLQTVNDLRQQGRRICFVNPTDKLSPPCLIYQNNHWTIHEAE